jgi:hypothetical protein
MMGIWEKDGRYQMNSRMSLISMSNIYRDGGYNGFSMGGIMQKE